MDNNITSTSFARSSYPTSLSGCGVSAFLLPWQPTSQPSNATNKSEDSKEQKPKQKEQRYAHGRSLSQEII
jgi:hypothetical protein